MLLCRSATPHKGFIWICATDHIQLGCDTISELHFFSLFVFQLLELVSMARVALGQGAAGNGHGAVRSPLETPHH